MDLYVLGVIIVVFLFSLITCLVISKLPRGKTFDEVLAEKKQIAEQLYGLSGGNKNRKNKKQPAQHNKKAKEKTKVKDVKESEQDSPDSDGASDNTSATSTNSPSHTSNKGHVEFVEAEIFTDSETAPVKKSLSVSGKKPVRKNSSSNKPPGAGILINKSDVVIKNTSGQNINATTVEPVNHFEQIQPKDDVEILRAQLKDETDNIKGNKNDKIAGNKDKKGKNTKNIQGDKPVTPPPKSPSPTSKDGKSEDKVNVKKQNDFAVVATSAVAVTSVVNHAPPAPVASVAVTSTPSVVAHVPSKEKTNKKNINKKRELAIVQKLVEETDEISVNFLILLLGKAELTRSEIQIVIDYLLNKQSDTITVNHSEWSEGKTDIVQKLKKQLSEKEKALQDEQEATIAIQAKLKELRTEINTEKIHYNATIKAYTEQIGQKNKDLQTMQTDIQILNEKILNEKQTMQLQLQQLQAKLLQEKKTNSQEHLQQIQQLTENNNVLKNDIVAKVTLINDLKEQIKKFAYEKHQLNENIKSISEYEKKLAEFDMIIRQKDERLIYSEQELNNLRQRAQAHDNELTLLNAENQRLHTDLISSQENYEKIFSMQQYDMDQLKVKNAELSKATHLEDAGKVEIRNLQNALDSCRTELTLCRNEIAEHKMKEDELNAQLVDHKKQISSYNTKATDQSKQVTELNVILSNYKASSAEKEAKLTEYEKQLKLLNEKEELLLKQLDEQKGKNNDLRTKNWKLIEALQNAESNAVKIKTNSLKNSSDNTKNVSLDLDVQKVADDFENRTKSKLIQLFPNVPPGPTQYDQWIEHLGDYVKQLLFKKSAEYNTSNNINSNSCNNSDDSDTPTTNHNNLSNSNSSSGTCETGMPAATETLLLQNAQLQSTVDEYKTIVAETEVILKNLELKVKEQDAYWRNVVQSKEEIIQGYKSTEQLSVTE